MTHDILASSNRVGNSHRPAVSGLNQLVCCPGTRGLTTINKTNGVDLEEFQLGLVNGATITIAGGKVCDDGAVVRVGPLSPLNVNVGSSLDICGEGCVLAVSMTDDIRVRKLGSILKAQISGGGGPSDALGWAVLVGVFIDKVTSVTKEVKLVCTFHKCNARNCQAWPKKNKK